MTFITQMQIKFFREKILSPHIKLLLTFNLHRIFKKLEYLTFQFANIIRNSLLLKAVQTYWEVISESKERDKLYKVDTKILTFSERI